MELLQNNDRVYEDVNAVVLSVPGSGIAPMVVGAPTVDRGTGRNLATSALNTASQWTDLNEIAGSV